MPEYPSLQELREKLGGYLRNRRFKHSENVAKAARKLARRHLPELVVEAEIAGLLHDNAKGMTDAQLLAEVQRLGIEPTPIESHNPTLLHGKVGAALLAARFGIDDDRIRLAVADHVTGRPGMDGLSLVLFVADQAAADRDFPGVDELRQASKQDLAKAAFLVAKHKLLYIVQMHRPLEPTTVEVYNELRSRIKLNGQA